MSDIVMGVDLSHWQKSIKWPTVGRHIEFAILKATEGPKTAGDKGYVDPTYKTRIGKLRAAKLLRGSYHFAAGGDPIVEADHYIDTAGRRNGELQALDFEGPILKHADPVGWAETWIRRVIERTGNIPVIYMSASVASRFNWARVIALNVGLWVASWSTKPPNTGAWPFWAIWQYTSDGNVPGIAGRVDLNTLNGDTDTWKKYASNTTKPKPKPKPRPKPKPKPKPRPKPNPNPADTYTVVSGDTLSSIAAAHGTEWRKLVSWNKDRYPQLTGNPNLIQPGWSLVVRRGGKPANATHTVVSGDTLSDIAKAYHTTWRELVELNHVRYPSLVADPGLIQPGWQLYLP